MRSAMILFLEPKLKEAILLTKSLFFDTDCLCAFLWIKNESLLPKLYPDQIVIPRPVYKEMCRPTTPQLKARVDALAAQNLVTIQDLDICSEEYRTYFQLTECPAAGHMVIGNGEAASIALARQYGGIVASNNLRDIRSYIAEFNLDHITTGDILVDAFHKGFITEHEGNILWAKMLAKQRRIGAKSFTDYLKSIAGRHN